MSLKRTPSATCANLVPAVEEMFLQLERWNGAKTISNDCEVAAMISKVKDIGTYFMCALKDSKTSAEEGARMARNMTTLFDSLLDITVTVSDMREFIKTQRSFVANAMKNSRETAEQFEAIRMEINLITRDIAPVADRLQTQQAVALQKVEVRERRGQIARAIKAGSAAGAAAVAAASVAAAAFPPALLIMPIILPLTMLAAEAFDSWNRKKIQKRESEARDSRDAMKDLRRVSRLIATFVKGLETVAGFWVHSDLILKDISSRVSELREDKKNRLELKTQRAAWEELRRDYTKYAEKVTRVCDLYAISARQNLEGSDTSSDDCIEFGKADEKKMLVRKPKVLKRPLSR